MVGTLFTGGVEAVPDGGLPVLCPGGSGAGGRSAMLLHAGKPMIARQSRSVARCVSYCRTGRQPGVPGDCTPGSA